MANLRARVGALVAILAFFPFFTFAQNNTTVAASTFFLSETETQFSINVANDSDDVFIYSTSPAYSWVGFGFGAKMENSLMFIMYPSKDGDNVTISPRIGSKKAEPTFTSAVDLEVLPGTTVNDNGMFVLRAVCRKCRTWPGGFLDVKSTAQPMIYAFGHGYPLYSDSKSANLKRHIRYGHYSMDMVAATGLGGVPANSPMLSGVQLKGKMTRDHDRANLAHAIIGCLALFVIWPLNVLFAGFFKNIRIHVGISVVIMAFLVVAYALGISTSAQFNRSQDYKTPHQVFAFIALAPIVLMSLLPIPSISKLHTLIPRLHTPMVSTSFLLLVLTGGLGLHLSSQARPVILGYTAVSLMVFIFITVLTSCIRRRGSAYARANNRKRVGEEDDNMVMLKKMDESRSSSKASFTQGSGTQSREFGADGQDRNQRGLYGGGTMPGPQYLLNMHPGVPVHKW
ncbi:CBD9-like protein [Ophiobolus disseminans]|uniref:CBD9-like protein n=1 Tax=Ophiobolus disseminans TaxID=1469910 RepID=A0A6A6ZPW5_9PLEO|nr:CBD9-like protein [Ophiobolus disseminans]